MSSLVILVFCLRTLSTLQRKEMEHKQSTVVSLSLGNKDQSVELLTWKEFVWQHIGEKRAVQRRNSRNLHKSPQLFSQIIKLGEILPDLPEKNCWMAMS